MKNSVASYQHSFLDTVNNERGNLLTNFMHKNEFTLLNGRCPSNSLAKHTFCNANVASVIDFVWVKSDPLDQVKDLEIIMETTSQITTP